MIDPVLTDIGIDVLKRRYLKRNETGDVIETPKDLYARVAHCIANADVVYGENPDKTESIFYSMMAKGDFLPNTPCLANAGWKEGSGQFSACFVLPIDDSMISIYTTLKNMALIHQSGGGTGFDFSSIRPNGDFVKSTTGVASGPISFMEVYNASTEAVKQSGIRRGANMGILRIDHPDILKFIDCKQNTSNIINFNISVAITNKFMSALEADEEYDLVSPRNNIVVGKLKAKDVWNKIIDNAWHTGEPGLFFVDRVNELDPLSTYLGNISATNPCGEVPLRAYDACTLGSINLSNFYIEKETVGTIDFDRLKTFVYHAVHFLDNVLTVNTYPIQEIKDVTSKSRKIGLGIMGWADLLIKLKISYASEKALLLAEEVMKFVNTSAVEASEALADRRGSFYHWRESVWAVKGDKPRRNSTVTVIAPTGSISIIAGCSSGIEPLFALAFKRNQAGMNSLDINKEFIEIAKREGWYSDKLMSEIIEKGSCSEILEVPNKWKSIFQVASDISSEWHVRMQAAFQKYTEDAVSKTINLPSKALISDVESAYTLAWRLGCKGITVYRDGSRNEQVLSIGKTDTNIKVNKKTYSRRIIPDSGSRKGNTVSKKTGYGTIHVTINDHPDDGEPFECFITLGKSGSEVSAFTEALGRSISLFLAMESTLSPRQRLDMLAEQFGGIGGGSQEGFGLTKVISAPDGIAHAILDYLYGNNETTARPVVSVFDICPQCNAATLAKGGKCDLCQSCGFSKC